MDTFCIYHISYLNTQKKKTQNGFRVSNSFQKNLKNLKPISNDLSPYAALTRP